MKKKFAFFTLWVAIFLTVWNNLAYDSHYVGEILRWINNVSEKEKLTKKYMVNFFCETLSTHSPEIVEATTFDPQKSIFLRLLCNETWIYPEWKFAQNFQIKSSFEKSLQNIWKEQFLIESIDSNCHLDGINTIEGSFNNINFACVAKKIFTPLANDLSNLLTLVSYWFFKTKDDLKKWDNNFFWTEICKKSYIYNDSNKPSLCNHPLTYNYLKSTASSLKSILTNTQVLKITSIPEFLENLVIKYDEFVPQVVEIKNTLYNELYFYNLFLEYYKAFLQYTSNQATVVRVWTEITYIQAPINTQIYQATNYQTISQTTTAKVINLIKDIYWTFPIHIGFLAILEDLDAFRHALAKIYTPLDQLRYKLENVQDLDK